MVAILWIFAVLEFAGGLFVLVTAKSAIHEILGTLAVGFSILTIGLAALLTEAQSQGQRIADHLKALRKYYEPDAQ